MKRIIISYAIMFWVTNIFGMVIESSLPFKNVSIAQGLPHNSVSAFYKDHNGYLWVGTKEGLARFDGNQLISYNSSIPDDVWSITTLNRDTLLLTTTSGIKWFETTNKTSGFIEDTPKIWFSSLCKMDSISILAGSEQGLYLIQQHAARRIPIDNMLAYSNHITGIIPAEDGTGFWFSTADGLGYIDSTLTPIVFRRKQFGNKDNYFTCLTTANGSIYLGSYNKGLFRFDIESQTFTHINTYNANLIMRLDADDENLYIGTNGRGMIIMDLKTGESSCAVHKSSNHNTIASNVVTALLNDDNAIYVGAQFGGISYHSKAKSLFSFYRTPLFNSIEHNTRSIYFYPDGEMLLGTRSGIFQIKDNKLINSIETSDFNSSLSSGVILYIGEAYGSVLVCSYGGGVKIYDRQTGRLYSFNEKEEYAQYGRIFHFVTDKRGHIWFASHEGIYETNANGDLLRHITSDNSTMRNDATYWLEFDKDERLWIASKFGLQILDPITGKMIGSLSCLPTEIDVRYVYRDSHDDMWICSNRGVYCINNKLELVRILDVDNILPENTVTSVVEMPKDVIRIATIHNLVNYNLNTGKSEVFRRHDGIGTGDFNGNVAINLIDSTVYWTNEGGLLYTSTSNNAVKSQNSLKPIITSIQIGDSLSYISTQHPENIKFKEGESLHLYLSHLDFRYPENESFEYCLEGKENKWKLLSGDNQVSFHSLSPGEYIFKVKNVGNEEYVSTKIIVKRHTWKIVLFWVGVLFLCGLIVVLISWIKRLYRRIAERTQIFAVLKKNKNKNDQPADSTDISDVLPINPLMTKLLTLIEVQNIYLDPKLKIADVAQMLGCKDIELSRMLNTEMSTNFTTFINTYRIKAIKKAMAEGDIKRYTITAIGLRYGYNSKMTFFRAFKSIEGKTPLEYCKEMGYASKIDE